MTPTTERPTIATWCPVHRYSTAGHCSGCAGDHKAGEHRDAPSASCRLCTTWTPTTVLTTNPNRARSRAASDLKGAHRG